MCGNVVGQNDRGSGIVMLDQVSNKRTDTEGGSGTPIRDRSETIWSRGSRHRPCPLQESFVDNLLTYLYGASTRYLTPFPFRFSPHEVHCEV